MKTILILSQDKEMFNLVFGTFRRDGFSCALIENTGELFKKFEEAGDNRPSAVILDLDNTDDVSGWDVCKIIKKEKDTKNIPIIMVTGNYKTSTDIVFGFQHGVDDYVIKPFNPNVLLARVKAILRRSADIVVRRKAPLSSSDKKIIVDVDKRIVRLCKKKKGRCEIADGFTPKEFDLLCLFLKKQNQALSREVIAESVWGEGFFDSSRTIDKHIETLRKKLGILGTRIASVSGVGYKFREK